MGDLSTGLSTGSIYTHTHQGCDRRGGWIGAPGALLRWVPEGRSLRVPEGWRPESPLTGSVCLGAVASSSWAFLWAQGTKLWIIMEYLGGGSALDLVRHRLRQWAACRGQEWTQEVAVGLGAAALDPLPEDPRLLWASGPWLFRCGAC